MLKTASQGQRAERKKAKFDVEIASVATAVPAHKICQAEMTKRAREVFPQAARKPLWQYRDRDPLRLRAARLVLPAPWMGNAHRRVPAPCA
jgi:predicted naringenin-chalcone synthase